MALDTDELAVAGLAYRLFERAKQGRIGVRVPEGLAWRIERRDTSLGEEEADGSVHPVEPLADPAAHALVLLRRGPHQRDLRVVDMELALAIALRDRVGRTEVDHVERADR